MYTDHAPRATDLAIDYPVHNCRESRTDDAVSAAKGPFSSRAAKLVGVERAGKSRRAGEVQLPTIQRSGETDEIK